MTATPTVHRYHTTEYLSRAHGDEFIVVIDSLGRKWNPLLHPRDENGRFIRTFSFVTFDLPGGTVTPGGEGGSVSGRVSGIDKDGNLLVKVSGVTPGAPPGVQSGDYVKVPHDQVQVRTIKAQLAGRGAAGVLNKQENDSVTTAIQSLHTLGLDDQANKLADAQAKAMEAPNPRDPKSVKTKQDAIDEFRAIGETLDTERGKGFDPGTDYDQVKDTLSSDEKARLQTLDQVIGTTFTARHSLGDNTVDAENDEGQVTGNKPEVRIQAAESELNKDFHDNAKVWDATSGTLVETHLEQPVKAQVRDTTRTDEGAQGLPELSRSANQVLQTGESRLSGYKQATQVAPGDRVHADKNGDEIGVGMVVHVDATKSRGEFTGMVTRIYTDKDGKKHVYARDFDPNGEKGYTATRGGVTTALTYKDHSVQGKSVEIASADQQSTLFQSLALQGQEEASKSLVRSFTDEYISAMQRRYASDDAKRISPTAGFFDVVPIHLRSKTDANGEMLHIGDNVIGPNGEQGVVTYMEPNENTIKLQYPNGQKADRITATKVTRTHGPSSDIYPDATGGASNYVPTREEAAQIADEMGADQVAQAIRDGADANTIQAAMSTDVQFQSHLDDADALYDKRDQTLAAGQELSPEDRTQLNKWDKLYSASAGNFREPNPPPPEPPKAPEPEADGERPGNPANPTETVSEGGVEVREADDGSVIVDNNTEDPIPADDPNAVEQAVNDAEGQQPPTETPPEVPPESQALADKLASDIGRLVDEAKQTAHVDQNQRTQLDQLNSRLADAVANKDGDAVVRSLESLTGMMNRQVNGNLHQTRLRAVLNGRATNGVPMHQFIQNKLDAGDDIFGAPRPTERTERPPEGPDETPEGIDPKVDAGDNAVSESLLMDDGQTLVMRGDTPVDEGFYVMDPATVTEYDNQPTTADISDFLNETQGSDHEGISVWYNEADGRYRMARVSIHDNEQDAADAARNSDANQYVNITDGSVMNVATSTDKNAPAEAVEDPRSEARHVRTAGGGKASARTTSKQKSMLDHVAGVEGADPEISRITDAVKNGEEINGADASRLADYVDGLDAGQFDKPSDKGVASQMAHRLARAAGEEGARGYSSQNTALRRTSDVGIPLTANSQDPQVRSLMDDARTDIKNGDNTAAAQKFRTAADIYDNEGHTRDDPSRRAREHADRLEAMGGVTAPAPEAEQEAGTAREALDAAGLPEVDPLTTSQFSNPDTPRTRQVTPAEYTALALKGKNRLDGILDDTSAPDGLSGQTWDEVKAQAWDAVQEDWGGITVDAHTGQAVTGDEDAYAITFRPPGVETVSVPIGSSQEDFDAAMERALTQFGGDQSSPLWAAQAHLGVFRNDDTGNYEIDPTLVLDNLDDVEAVGAYSGSGGGAYNFKDGLGYWPPHVAEEQAGGPGQAGPEGVPGTRRLEGTGPQGGEAEPGVPPQEQAPAGPAGGGPEAPQVGITGPADQFPTPAEMEDVMSSAESYLDSEVNAEGDNGPQGWNATLEDVNNGIQDLLKQIKANPNDTALATDLRALASEIGDNFRLSDPGPLVDELNELADRIDNNAAPGDGSSEGPSAGAPGEEQGVGGGAPFRVDQPDGIRNALLDDSGHGNLEQRETSYLDDTLKGLRHLLDQVEEGSVANNEVNAAKFLVLKRLTAATRMREELRRKAEAGTLTPDDVTQELDRFGDDAQHVLDIWNGTGDSSLSADKLADFMKQRIDATATSTRDEANSASREDAPFDLRWIRSQMETGSTDAANRMDDNQVKSLPQYQQLVTEMTSILSTAQALRDPANRASLRPDQVRDLPMLMRRLEADVLQSQQFLSGMRDQGFDVSGLESALTEQLDKFDVGHLTDNAKLIPQDLITKGNQIGKDYRELRDTGDPATDEAAALLENLLGVAKAVNVPAMHNQIAPAVKKLVMDQAATNGGTIPDPIAQVMEDPEWQRFGAFSDVLGRLDIENMVKNGDVDDLSAATGGRYTTVNWEHTGKLDPDLISDDRPQGGGVASDMAWREGQAMITPNVSSALNSMFASMGGGIHRVRSDITQADVPDAERWKSDGWNRAGSDMRTPDQVEGVYAKDSNLVVVADSRMIADTGRGSNVLVHELGHALDSMLGETLSEGGWFHASDPEFHKFHDALKKTASYGDSPEQSLMHWYFRNEDEGAVKHNAVSGSAEIFAEGYAAYASGLQRLANLPDDSGPITEETSYVLIGRQLTADRGQLAEWADELTFEQVREREGAMGHAIYDFFHALENERLPKLMEAPKPIPVKSELRSAILGLNLGATPNTPIQTIATTEQKVKANTHLSKQHGLIHMQQVERGTPEWTTFESTVKQVSPGATMPPPTALYVTWNPSFADQGSTVIWKAVMPGQPKYVVEYTDQHKATQLAAKFQRQQRVNTALDEVHAKAEAEAAYDETAALVLAMIETGMRVGSSEKAGSVDRKTGRKKPTFGGATMQAKHVFFPSNTLMRFRFPGKAGKENTYESRNPALRAAVQQLLQGKKPSDQVFSGTNSARTIDYLRTATGIDDIINHDTRTRFATNLARELVAKVPKSKMPKNEAEFKKWQSGISKTVGVSINDTWQVARDSYISPAVWEPLEDSAGLPHSFDDSPPLGLVEGQVVEHIGGPAVGPQPAGPVPGAPVTPAAPETGAPAAPAGEAGGPVAAAAGASPPPSDDSDDDEVAYSLDQSPAGVTERQTWYDSYRWPTPPIIAPPDTSFTDEDGDEEPAQTEAPQPTGEA